MSARLKAKERGHRSGARAPRRIQPFRLEAPAGAPIQVQGTVEGTPEARTLVRVDSVAWSRTKPLGSYSFSGGVNPYSYEPVRLRLYVNGQLQSRIVCAAQGRNTPAGRYDQTHPGRIDLRLAQNWAEPLPDHVCQSF